MCTYWTLKKLYGLLSYISTMIHLFLSLLLSIEAKRNPYEMKAMTHSKFHTCQYIQRHSNYI